MTPTCEQEVVPRRLTAGLAVPTVMVGMPSYDGMIVAESAGAWMRPTRGRCRVGPMLQRGSLLANGFNTLWCNALNEAAAGRINRFAMLHADVCPDDRVGWVDVLEDVLQASGADVVSVVVPIKDRRGLTSTAIGDPHDWWRVTRRLTMVEVFDLPETFRVGDVRDVADGSPLLVNTGCWMCRLDRGDWQRKVHFEIRDRIMAKDDGTLVAQCMPEDWNWSRQMHDLGVDVVATRKLAVKHIGAIDYSNAEPWGVWTTDQMQNPTLCDPNPEEAG